MNMENHGGMMLTGETPDSSTRVRTSSHLVAKQEDLGKGYDEFSL
jgi:hypothetical protein